MSDTTRADSSTDTAFVGAGVAGRRVPRVLPGAAPLNDMLTRKPEPLDFILPGLVRRTVGAMIGPGGIGKSFWLMQTCVSMVSGVDLVGLQPRRGSVLYLAGEDPECVYAERLRSMTAGHSDMDGLSPGLDLRVLIEQSIDLMVEEWFERVLEVAKGRDLVVLDTLTRFHNLDENSALDMKKLVSQLERLASLSDTAVLYVHHTSKAAAMAGLGASQQAARGSSVLVDNARWACFLAPMSKNEARSLGIAEDQREHYVRWNISKQNYSSAVADVWYRRNSTGVLLPISPAPPSAKPAPFMAMVPTAPAASMRGVKAPVGRSRRGPSKVVQVLDTDGSLGQVIEAEAKAGAPTCGAPAGITGASKEVATATGAYEGNW